MSAAQKINRIRQAMTDVVAIRNQSRDRKDILEIELFLEYQRDSLYEIFVALPSIEKRVAEIEKEFTWEQLWEQLRIGGIQWHIIRNGNQGDQK